MVLDIGMEENTITLMDGQDREIFMLSMMITNGEMLFLVRATAINMVLILMNPNVTELLNIKMMIVVIIIDKMVMEGDKLHQDRSQGALLGKEGCTRKELQGCALNTHV